MRLSTKELINATRQTAGQFGLRATVHSSPATPHVSFDRLVPLALFEELRKLQLRYAGMSELTYVGLWIVKRPKCLHCGAPHADHTPPVARCFLLPSRYEEDARE